MARPKSGIHFSDEDLVYCSNDDLYHLLRIAEKVGHSRPSTSSYIKKRISRIITESKITIDRIDHSVQNEKENGYDK